MLMTAKWHIAMKRQTVQTMLKIWTVVSDNCDHVIMLYSVMLLTPIILHFVFDEIALFNNLYIFPSTVSGLVEYQSGWQTQIFIFT